MTEKIKFCYTNLVEQDATVITGSTEDSFFPASNLKSTFSSKVWRSTTASANVVFDFVTTEPVDTLIVKSHYDTGRGFLGSLTFEANATNVWTSPAFSTTVSFNDTYNLGF